MKGNIIIHKIRNESQYLQTIDKLYFKEKEYIKALTNFYLNFFKNFPDDTLYGHFTLKQLEKGKIHYFLLLRYFRRLRKWLHMLLYGKKNSWKIGKAISYVIGFEQGQSGRHTHCHVIFAGENLGQICRMCIKNMFEFCGWYAGMCRIWKYDFNLGKKRGFFYLAKHQIKEKNIIDFFVNDIVRGQNRCGPSDSVLEMFEKAGIELEGPIVCYGYCKVWE